MPEGNLPVPTIVAPVMSNNTPGTPAAGGLKDDNVDSSDEASLVISAMDALDSEDRGDEEAGAEAGPGNPPTGDPLPTASVPAPEELAALQPKPETVPQQPAVSDPSVQGVQAQTPAQQAPVQTPQPPGQQPVVPPVVQGQPTQQEALVNPEDGFAELANQFQKNRQTIVDLVATHEYKLSDEQIAAVQTEPEKELPKLLARVHVNAISGVLAHVANQIPQVVHGLLEARTRYEGLEKKFFDSWPQLDRDKHGPQVKAFAQAYRRQNPEASFEDVVKIVGAQTIVANGLHTQPVQQAQPRPATQVPFTPAGASAAPGTVQRPKAPTNPFEVWNEILEADEAGSFDG